jgi:hypothetical protein
LSGGLEHQPSPCGWAEASLVVGPMQAQPRMGGPGPAPFFKKKKLAKKYCLGFFFLQFPRVFVTLFFINIGLYFYVIKNTKSSIKIPGFRQNFQNTKNFEKKNFVHMAKCLKAKKSYCVFYTPKNNVLACILALITSLLKSREHWPKFQKNNKKFYFVLSFSIRGTILHVIRIPDIKSFSNVRTVRFYPIR